MQITSPPPKRLLTFSYDLAEVAMKKFLAALLIIGGLLGGAQIIHLSLPQGRWRA
jgi:hypothetical protein